LVQPLGVMTARVDTARSKPGACCAAQGASAASDVSQRMLAQTLRGLQHEGLVARALLPLVAPGLAQDRRGGGIAGRRRRRDPSPAGALSGEGAAPPLWAAPPTIHSSSATLAL
jgi:hypothetical protein